MRVLRFTSPKVEGRIPIYRALSLAADRHVAVMHAQELHIYDLHGPSVPVARISDVVDHALAPTCLVVADTQGTLTRWEAREGSPAGWEPGSSFSPPDTVGAASNVPTHLLLSASGRYVLVESAPIRRQAPLWAVSRAYLLDALTGEVKRAFDLRKTWVRGGFACLPSGEDVLFISAESYMSVQMVACASGRTLQTYTTQMSWDFCHTAYALTADATRLLAFGCIWAAPYEARIYDATPWTMPQAATQPISAISAAPQPQTGSGAAAASPFPLPLLFCQEEVFEADIVLPLEAVASDDGTIPSVALVDLAGLPIAGSAGADEVLGVLTQTDRAIYNHLSQLPRSGTGVVIRRVSPITGAVVGWSVAATAKTEERHVHVLPNHHVLLVNERIEIVDGLTGEVHDEGPFEVPVRWFTTMPTTAGDTLLVYWSEGAQ
jgi:hypothetical protein